MGICRSDGSGLCDSRNCLQNRDEKLQGKFAEREKGAMTMIVQTKKKHGKQLKKCIKQNIIKMLHLVIMKNIMFIQMAKIL